MTAFYNSQCPVCLEEFQSVDEILKKERNSAKTGREGNKDPSAAEKEARDVNAIDLEMGSSRPDTPHNPSHSSKTLGTYWSVVGCVI